MAYRPKVLKPGRTEKQVLQAVLEALAIYGIEPARRNTGGAINPSGRLVMFGQRGDSDIQTQIPGGWIAPNGRDISGKVLHIETKRENFDPRKARGKERERFDRQLARLRLTNANGGFALWVSDSLHVIKALEGIKAGLRIVIGEDEFPYLTDEAE